MRTVLRPRSDRAVPCPHSRRCTSGGGSCGRCWPGSGSCCTVRAGPAASAARRHPPPSPAGPGRAGPGTRRCPGGEPGCCCAERTKGSARPSCAGSLCGWAHFLRPYSGFPGEGAALGSLWTGRGAGVPQKQEQLPARAGPRGWARRCRAQRRCSGRAGLADAALRSCFQGRRTTALCWARWSRESPARRVAAAPRDPSSRASRASPARAAPAAA